MFSFYIFKKSAQNYVYISEPTQFPVPKYWKSMHDELSENFNLEEQSDEWKDVAQRFKTSLSDIQIVQIKRLQNMYRWEVFYL